MDDDEGVNGTEKNPEGDSNGKDHERIVKDDQETFGLECNSGMQQSERADAGNFGRDSDAVTDCELKTENLECTNDLMDLPPEGSFEMSEDVTEFERKFLQHRHNKDLNFLDISLESDESIKSDQSSDSNEICKPERQVKCKVGEHSNSIPGFYDCDERVLGFLANNDISIPVRYEEVITRQLNELILKGLSNENSSPDQNYSQTPRVSPKFASVPYHSSSRESGTPVYSELLQILERFSKTSGENKDMPQHSNNSSLDNAEKSYDSSDLGIYSMISSPISSKYIKLERTQSSPDSLNLSIDHTTGIQRPVLNPSPISPDRLSNDNLSTTAQIDNSSIYFSSTYQTILSRNMETPSSSNTHSPKNCPKSISGSSSNSSVKNKSKSCLDIPSSSKGPTQLPSKAICKPKCSRLLNFDEPDSNKSASCLDIPSSSTGPTQLPSTAVYKPKCSRLLNFDESDSNKSTSCLDIPTSSEEPTQLPAKGIYKPKCSRLLNFDESDSSGDEETNKFCKGKENRMKRKLFDLSDRRTSYDENHPDVSENASSSKFCSKKPRKSEENESTISVLRPLKIINSENLEANQSFRKRLYSSTSKTSDIELSDEECKSEKKPKLCTSSESES